ncbi:Uncharacterised protein [Bacteroides xylanisolvens]|nr:Uncharacterised protein [Bacteroides xylanisolvens]
MTLLTPSAAGWAAKFCSTAIVAELLCTTSVITPPRSTPKTGVEETSAIRSTKTLLPASGFITCPMISIPSKSSPKEKMTMPIFFSFSVLPTNCSMKPMKMMG